MNKLLEASSIVAITLSLLGVAPAAPKAQGRLPANGACFYRDADFRGPYFCVNVNDARASLPGGANDEISSIRLFGRAEVVVYRDESYRGNSRTFNGNVANLASEGFNDRVSSLRVRAGSGFGGGFGGGQFGRGFGNQQVPQQGVCFYQDAGFEGDRFCLNSGDSARSMPSTFNDAVSSIQLFGGASVTIYEHDNFGGQSIQISSSVRNLADARSPNGFRWNDVVSSIRVENGQFGGGSRGGFGRGQATPRQGACFYQDAGFQGDRFCLNSGDSASSMPLGFNDAVSSIQVFGGASVTVYEHENFGGQSIRVSIPARNLDASRAPNGFRWNDVISSVRVN